MKTKITNAVIVDGAGNIPFKGEILINGSIIERVSSIPIDYSADICIDAKGRFLAPGFIDIHSHYDLANFIEEGMKDKVTQGITSEVVGACGLGVAPVLKEDQDKFRDELVIGNPPVEWTWESFEEYLSALKEKGLESNIVPFASHGVLRYLINKSSTDELSLDQIDRLKNELEKCFLAGAQGVSLGLIYHPAIYSTKEEIQAVFEVAKKYDKLVMVHLRSESDEIVESIKEMIELAGDHICKLHISHLKIIGKRNASKLKEVFQLIEKNNILFDQYPFNFGSTSLLSIIPPHIFEGKGLEEVLKSFDNPFVIQEIAEYFSELRSYGKGVAWDNLPALVGWDNIFVNSDTKSILQLAKEEHIEPIHLALKLLQKNKGNVRMIDSYMDESLVEKIFCHKNSMIGTDALIGVPKHPRVYNTYPKIIYEFVFQKRLLSLENAIKKMTSIPASRLGLIKRGAIKEGYFADLVMFGDRIDSVWINGVLKVESGIYNQLRSGFLLDSNL